MKLSRCAALAILAGLLSASTAQAEPPSTQPVAGVRGDYFVFDNANGTGGETGREGDQFVTEFPIPVDAALMQRGRERYNVFCATCHGLTGEGGMYEGMTARRARARGETLWFPPAALTSQSVREQPVGKIFDTITHGVVREGRHSMPPYAVQIPPRDRWAIILYMLALQRARAPSPDDFGAASRTAASSPTSAPTSPEETRAAEGGTGESSAESSAAPMQGIQS